MILPARFFRCQCGKLHCDTMISTTTRCSCGIYLARWLVRR